MRHLVYLVGLPLIFDCAFGFVLSLGGQTPNPAHSHVTFADWDGDATLAASTGRVAQTEPGHLFPVVSAGLILDGVAADRIGWRPTPGNTAIVVR